MFCASCARACHLDALFKSLPLSGVLVHMQPLWTLSPTKSPLLSSLSLSLSTVTASHSISTPSSYKINELVERMQHDTPQCQDMPA